LISRAKKPIQDQLASPTRIFNIVWLKVEILGVSAMEYAKCVKCLLDAFEGGWRYSQKWSKVKAV